MIEQVSPIYIKLLGYEDKIKELKQILTYKNLQKEFELKRFRNNKWLLRTLDDEEYVARVNALKSQVTVCLLEERPDGFYTLSGLKDLIANYFQDFEFKTHVIYPEPNGFKLSYIKPLPFSLRPYQVEAVEKLTKVKHGAVSLPTGSGKSMLALELIKSLGLKTVITAPSVNIARQLYETFKTYLGQKWVGFYGNGKKDIGKLITISIAQSLVKIEPNSKAWNAFQSTEVFVFDESQFIPAQTMQSLGLGLFQNVPYRFFTSATQFRNDGSDLLLKGLIGPLALDLSAKDLVDRGYLAKPHFMLVKAKCGGSYQSDNAQLLLKKCLYTNSSIHKKAAELANMLVKHHTFQVLIMIDHIAQFQYLLPYLKYDAKFAHGGITKDNKRLVPEAYHKCDTNVIVKQFNDKEFKILIGTGAVSTGTDFTTVNAIINLQGGKSAVKFTQVVGRGTRKAEGKDDFFFIDFDISDNYVMHNHFLSRVRTYRDIYDNVKQLDF